MQNIARRYQQAFPNIFPEIYSHEHFHFRHTSAELTNASLQAFATGLFGELGAENVVYEDVPDNDWFLRPFDFCPQFDEEVGWISPEMNAFLQGPEIEELIEQVSRKLGFTASNQLTFRQISSMWDWCRFETVSKFEFADLPTGGDHAWCAPFSVAHHHLLEYADDLFYFYTSGYGVPNQRLIRNLPCGLAQDLLNHLQSTNEQRVRIFVSYAQEFQSLLVTLGLFRDVWPIHRHNYAQQFTRNWKTSLLTPTATNLGVIIYE